MANKRHGFTKIVDIPNAKEMGEEVQRMLAKPNSSSGNVSDRLSCPEPITAVIGSGQLNLSDTLPEEELGLANILCTSSPISFAFGISTILVNPCLLFAIFFDIVLKNA